MRASLLASTRVMTTDESYEGLGLNLEEIADVFLSASTAVAVGTVGSECAAAILSALAERVASGATKRRRSRTGRTDDRAIGAQVFNPQNRISHCAGWRGFDSGLCRIDHSGAGGLTSLRA
jgi:hypothetical protein